MWLLNIGMSPAILPSHIFHSFLSIKCRFRAVRYKSYVRRTVILRLTRREYLEIIPAKLSSIWQLSTMGFSSQQSAWHFCSCSKSSCSCARTVLRAGAAMSTTVEAAETRSEALQALLWSFCGSISKLEVQKGLQEDDFCKLQSPKQSLACTLKAKSNHRLAKQAA